MRKRFAYAIRVAACLAAMQFGAAHAIQFELDFGDGITGVLNTNAIAGAAWRMEDRSPNLVGKANLNPGVCGSHNQSCQGLFREQDHPALALVNAPGQYSPNFDDGNLNYDQHDLVSGLVKVTTDLTMNWGDFGIFAKALWFYDHINNDFTEFHPNRITRENVGRTGCTGGLPIEEGCNSNPLFARTYGPGEVVHNKRTEGEILREVGTDLQLFDLNFFGILPMPGERQLTFKIGRQTVNWGESTALAINSINQTNPPNANNLFRVGFDLSELFIPTGMAFLSTEPFENTTIEAYYQWEWQPLEVPAPGSYFSFIDAVGNWNSVQQASISFGGAAEDPDRVGGPLNNPLSGVTPTTTTILRAPDNEPDDQGQFGVSLKYFAEWLNNGTEIGLYFMNYHSKLPYISTYATQASCARREGNDMGIDATDPVTFLLACPDLPFTRGSTFTRADHDANPADDAVPLDTMFYQVEYPEDIQMYGISFNTTFGDLSFQGEVAYRPNLPLQIDAEDLVFAAFGPTLSRCHDPNVARFTNNLTGDEIAELTDTATELIGGLVGTVPGLPEGVPILPTPGFGCVGSTAGIGTDATGSETVYTNSDFIDADGNNPYPDTFDLLIGHAPGSARAFPAFVTAYRGGVVGENPPTDLNQPLNEFNPGYIRGYERFKALQYNLGGTYVMGATDNPIGADQIIVLFEIGAMHVPDMPGLDELQFEASGTHTHASAGADGSGADGSRQACSSAPDGSVRGSCSVGIDGMRFNPHQQELEGYPDDFSAGYALVSLIRYESILPGISLQPLIIFQHDVHGTSPDVVGQFQEGRKDIQLLFEIRYKESLSITPAYYWFTGGGTYNTQRDRDTGIFYVKYQF